ncbi:uncharacterized membrane protein YcaP (DUF421 family) [Salirhabdus euzebyi]|uniref:Uncharacterized membrane protein YcaP (DUF421 family) n=1 Tax=Salirhabdus euzebyi TaxID=394506 RepID=A0A841Q2D6_9BACI|nr:YetF domain-containing protein [Salirhabdus euzebyi]MBB6452712.1 uncharacterized membrane protein YcaP (DUF421 family) [Salirhabdus euzebyi]
MPSWIQAIIYIVAAILLLRIGGKRTISQATPSEVAIMIGIGTVLVHPLKSEDPWISVYHGSLIILGLIILSLTQIYFTKTKKWIQGEPLLLIKDGNILTRNLKKARITEDELKMKLRIKKVSDISTLKSVTLEISGDIGVEKNNNEIAATKKDIEDMKNAMEMMAKQLNMTIPFNKPLPKEEENNLFNQVKQIQEKDPLQ